MLAPAFGASDIRTRFLIISDTHASPLVPSSLPTSLPADVAIHCGDLTKTSTLTEYEEALALLKSLKNIPLKLVIAGNHEFSLDDAVYTKAIGKNTDKKGKSVVTQEQIDMELTHGKVGQARELFCSKEARMEYGIHFLDEGRHQFPLMNGAFFGDLCFELDAFAIFDTFSRGQGEGQGE